MNCEICQNWARTDDPYKIRSRGTNLPLLTNHHPNCPHYNDSLMDVWKVTDGSSRCYLDNEEDAKAVAGESEESPHSITKEKMHREIFENLPEFEGF